MAIAHCSVKTVSRSGGRSATAAAAYRTAERVADQRTGEVHDYRRRGGVEHVAMHLPAGAPAMTTSELWSAAELAEKRKNSTVAREVEVALPHELAPAQRQALADQIAQRLVERYQVAAQVAVHTPDQEGDQRNHHAHILCTTRVMDSSGQLGAKTRQLDDQKTGPQEVLWIRGMVEQETNQALARAGIDARIDMRSLADQGIDRAPTTHEGPRVTQIRRECEREQREPLGACDVIELNDARRLPPLAELRAESQQLEAEIIDLSQRRLQRQIEQAHAEALAEAQRRDAADELAALIEQEQSNHLGDLQAIEIEQLRDQVAKLDQYGFHPPRYDEAAQLMKQLQATEHAAVEWRAAHPVVSRVLDAVGMRSPAEREADRAREAVRSSPAVQEAAAWQRAERQREQQLAEARQRLAEALERMPPPIHAESPPPEPGPVSVQHAAAELEQAEAAPEWIEWEDAGELYGQWEDSQQVYWHDSQQGEWLRAEDRPAPEPEPQQRYSGPRMG